MPDRRTSGSGPDTFGFGGDAIDLTGGDYPVPDTVKAITVVAAGNVVYRSVDGSADITVTSAFVGYELRHHALIIRQSGTTATLATVI